MDTILINKLKRQIGQLTMRVGIKQISEAISDFSDTEGDYAMFCKPLLGLPAVQMDVKYYFTNWENWQKIIETINPILLNNWWIAERFDCDKRSFLVTSLVALLFEINTVRPVYCSVYDAVSGNFFFNHMANIIVDVDGNAYLWDVDCVGMTTKITSNPVIMNGRKYVMKSVQ